LTGLLLFFIAQPIRVKGDSMLPNYFDKEELIAEKLSVKYEKINRGDIVIVKHPEDERILVIKRVIGLPGEDFKIEGGKVFIDGQVFEEPYLNETSATEGGTKLSEGVTNKIPEDSYVLLGDNRKDSADSRLWGPVKKELLLGKGFFVYKPIENIRFITSPL